MSTPILSDINTYLTDTNIARIAGAHKLGYKKIVSFVYSHRNRHELIRHRFLTSIHVKINMIIDIFHWEVLIYKRRELLMTNTRLIP